MSIPVYHDEKPLRAKEVKLYASLISLIDCWHNFPPQAKVININQYIRQHHKKTWDKSYRKLIKVQISASEQNIQIKIPSDSYYEHPLTHLGFAIEVPVPDIAVAATVIQSIAGIISDVSDLADYFWFIPIFNEERWIEGAFRIGSNHLGSWSDGTFDQWELMVPIEVPDGVLDTLPACLFKKHDFYELSSGNDRLKAMITSLHKMWQYLKPLRKANDTYRQQLYKILRGTLDQNAAECRQLAGELRELLSEISESIPNRSALDDFNDRLTAIQDTDHIEKLIKLQYEISINIEQA